MAENISEKKSRVVTYNGNDSKIKMLVEALNYNTEDTLHDQVTYNGSTQETRTGDIDVVWDSNFTVYSNDDNYAYGAVPSDKCDNIIKIYSNNFNIYVNKDCIKHDTRHDPYNRPNEASRKYIRFSVNEWFRGVPKDTNSILVGIKLALTYFDLQSSYKMLGLIICPHDEVSHGCPEYYSIDSQGYHKEWMSIDNETPGDYYIGSYGYYNTPFIYQSFYKDSMFHTYLIDISPLRDYYHEELNISIVMDCLNTNRATYYEDDILIECSSIINPDVLNGQFISSIKQFNGKEWLHFMNPGSDVLYGKNYPLHIYGRTGDVYFRYSDSIDHNQLSNIVTSVNEHKYKDEEWDGDTKISDAKYAYFNTWKYDNNISSGDNGVSFSYSGYNLRYLRKTTFDCYNYGGQSNLIQISINDEADLYFRISDLPSDKEYKFSIEFYIQANSAIETQTDKAYDRVRSLYPGYDKWDYYDDIGKEYDKGILLQNNYHRNFSNGLYKYEFEYITSSGYIDFHLGVQSVDQSSHIFSYYSVNDHIPVFSNVEELAQNVSSPQYKTVYLVGDESENNVTPYYWNGERYAITPRQEDLITVTISRLKVSYVSSFDKIFHKLDDVWIEQKSSGGGSGGSEVEVEPILQSGTPIADISVDQVSYTLYAPNGGSYELPIASVSTLGGIKVGSGLSINPSTGELSVTGGGGGGTTVVPNPVGTPTDDLNTVQIGQTIYDIPDGVEAIELTKAAYESKSQAEKEDPTKIYFVTDYGTEDETYSTTETVIGKWIDGKPIYRIVLDYHQTPITNLGIDVSALSIDTLIRTDALGTDDSSNYAYPKWTLNSVSGSNSRLIYMQNATTLKVEGSFYKYWVILEYTKTTDS